MIEVCTGKIHRAIVTGADLEYSGSVTICRGLMARAQIRPYQLVHINSLANAAHWETYAIPGKPGELTLNGPPAHLFAVGDVVVVNAFELIDRSSLARDLKNRTVFVDEENRARWVATTWIEPVPGL